MANRLIGALALTRSLNPEYNMETEEPPRTPQLLHNAKQFFKCDWLLCLLKVQRQMLALTSVLDDHSKCSNILNRLGGKFGVFFCCHGEKFLCNPDTENDADSSSPGVHNGSGCGIACPSSSHEFSSDIDGVEEYLTMIKRSYRNGPGPFPNPVSSDELTMQKYNIGQFADGKAPLMQLQPSSEQKKCSALSNATFDCPICMEELPKKQAFACNDFKHAVCMNCTKSLLLRWYSSNDTYIQCPVCRRLFPMEEYVQGFLLSHAEELEDIGRSLNQMETD